MTLAREWHTPYLERAVTDEAVRFLAGTGKPR